MGRIILGQAIVAVFVGTSVAFAADSKTNDKAQVTSSVAASLKAENDAKAAQVAKEKAAAELKAKADEKALAEAKQKAAKEAADKAAAQAKLDAELDPEFVGLH